jgi:hypothetical protein
MRLWREATTGPSQPSLTASRLGIAIALLSIGVFTATVSLAELGPFGWRWALTTDPGPNQRLSPDAPVDALLVRPGNALIYYASFSERPAHVRIPVNFPGSIEALDLEINAHNSNRLHVAVEGAGGERVERDLPAGRLIWADVPLSERLRAESHLHVAVTLEGRPEGPPTTLYGVRVRGVPARSNSAWRTGATCALTLAVSAVLFLISARLFARAATSNWRDIARIDAAALWPVGLLAMYPILRAGGIDGAARLALMFCACAYWMVRTSARIQLVDRVPSPDRAGRALLASCFVFATLVFGKPIVNGDGVQYYAYVRTTVVDRDLYIGDEYREGLSRFLSSGPALGTTPRGYDYAFAPVGAAVFWLPPMYASHAIGLALRRFGLAASIDGYSVRYLFAVAATSWLMMFIGLLCCYQTLAHSFDRRTNLVAVLCGLFASPLFANAYELPMFVHAVDFCLSSAFAFAMVITASRGLPRHWFISGLLGGLLVATRQQNVGFFVLPAIVMTVHLAQGRVRPARALLLAAIGGAGCLIGFLPQIAMNMALFGKAVVFHPIYLPSARWPPALWRDLFSSKQGLFFWAPLMLAAMLGLFHAMQDRRHRLWASLATVAVGSQVILVGIVPYGPNLIGPRYLVNCIPYLIWGLAAFFALLQRRVRSAAARYAVMSVLVVPAIFWNIGLDTLIVRGLIDKWGPLPPAELVRKQFTVGPLHWGDHLLGLSINQPSFSVFIELGRGLTGDLWALLQAGTASFLLIAGTGFITAIAHRSFDREHRERFPEAAVACIILLVICASGIWLYLGWEPGVLASNHR